MTRQVRMEYAGAVSHARARGNQGRPVFSEDPDRRQWLQTLAEACEKTGWRIHAYIHLNPARAKLIRIGKERLGMGEESGVTRAVRTVPGSRAGELERMKRRRLRISAARCGED